MNSFIIIGGELVSIIEVLGCLNAHVVCRLQWPLSKCGVTIHVGRSMSVTPLKSLCIQHVHSCVVSS